MYFRNFSKLFKINKVVNRLISTEIVIKSKSKIVIPSKLIEDYVWKGLDKWHDKTAVVCIDTDRTFTYGEIYRKTKNLSYHLKKLGLNEGDTVAIVLPNIPEFPITFLGAIQAGLKVTTINPNYTAAEMAIQLKDSNSKLIFTTTVFWDHIKKATLTLNEKIPVVITDQNDGLAIDSIKLEDLLINPDVAVNGKLHFSITPDDVVLLPYSSGTTGLSKGVQLTHKNVVSNLSQMSSKDFTVLIDNNEQQVIPVFLPMFHIYGMVAIFLNFFSQGCLLVTFPKFGLHAFMKLLKVYKPSITFAVPPLIRLFLNNPRIKGEILESVHTIISAAAPLGVSDVERFREKTKGKIDLLQMYGMTETCPLTLMQTKQLNYGVKLGGSGFLIPNTESKIISIENDNLSGLESYRNGEILMRGPQVMKGYLNNPEATKSVMLPDGWLRTGDIGYYDEDEHFFITDRLKEMIKVKGFQVAPAELEEILRTHPLVEDCAVVGVLIKDKGEVPRAFVVLRHGMKLNGQVLVDYVAKKVSNHKRLTGGVCIVDFIPKTPAGKVLRRQLKNL